MDNRFVNRRKLVGLTVGATAYMTAQRLQAASCKLTPRQPEGPFYPKRSRLDEDNDLTTLEGQTESPIGEQVLIMGVVKDQYCLPVKDALVDIWQASDNGRYDHPGDIDNERPLDPNFQYWGKTLTNSEGEYTFKTIIPGHYQASGSWIRPPHIHYKVTKRGYMDLITQMYFAGNKYNSQDKILKRLSSKDKDQVIINFSANKTQSIKVGEFNITLEKIE